MRSFLKRVRSAMSRRVERRAFHASGPEKENARSPMDVRHLGSRYNVLTAEHRPGRVGLSAMAETVSANSYKMYVFTNKIYVFTYERDSLAAAPLRDWMAECWAESVSSVHIHRYNAGLESTIRSPTTDDIRMYCHISTMSKQL